MVSSRKPVVPRAASSSPTDEQKTETAEKRKATGSIEDDQIAALYRRETTPTDRRDCPSADQLAALSSEELGPSERRPLALHLATCSECSTEVQALKRAPPTHSITSTTSSEEEQQHASPSNTSEPLDQSFLPTEPSQLATPRAPWLLAASLLLLVACSAWFLLLRQPLDVDTVRSGTALSGTPLSSTNVPTGYTISPPPDSVLDELPLELQWKHQEDTSDGPFELRLLTAEGDVLAEISGIGTSISMAALDQRIQDQLRRGGRFHWTVIPASGRLLGPYWFEIRSPGPRNG